MNEIPFDPIKEFGEDLRREPIPSGFILPFDNIADGANVPVIISLRKEGDIWKDPDEVVEHPVIVIHQLGRLGSKPSSEYVEEPDFTGYSTLENLEMSTEETPSESEYVPEIILPKGEIEILLPPTDSVLDKQYQDFPYVPDDLSLPDEDWSSTQKLVYSRLEAPIDASVREMADVYTNSFKFRLLPIKGNTKIPAIAWRLGEEMEFTAKQYDFYWSSEGNFGNIFGVGMRADNYYIIDIDMSRDKKKYGDESFLRLFGEDSIEKLMDHTLWQVTGGGGLQFFFRLSPEIAPYLNNSAGIFGDEYPDIDCRYDTKGITVLPPSIHPSGIEYRWGNLRERLKYGKDAIQTAPDWFASKTIEARIAKVKKNSKTKYQASSTNWKNDPDLAFDIESFDEVKERVFETVKTEAESRTSGQFAHARVDSYDGSERLAIYASKNGVIGDWKMHPKTEVLLSLGIDPRVWLLQYDTSDHHFVQAFYYYFGHRIIYVPETKQWSILQEDLTWKFYGDNHAIYSYVMELVDDWLLAWRRAEIVRQQRDNQERLQAVGVEEEAPVKRGRPKKKAKSKGEQAIQWLLSFRNGGSFDRVVGVMQKYSRYTRYAGDMFHETLVRGRADFDVLKEDEFPANNGVVNLRTKEIRPYSASDFITTKSTVNFNADLRTESFVKQAAWWVGGNLELLRYVQKVAGYGITADVSVSKLFILFGEDARNGKSTLMDLMTAVLGTDLAKPTNLSTLTNERESGYALGESAASRLMMIREGSFRALNTMVVKFVTGDRTVTARPIYGKPFNYQRKFKLWMATNTMPTITDFDGGIERRLAVIPFTRIPDNVENLNFFDEWSKKLDIILSWLVEGAYLFYKEGLADVPKEVTEETAKQTSQANSAAAYLEENFESDPEDLHKTIFRSWIYEDYFLWCQKIREMPVSNRQFYQTLRTRIKTARDVNIPDSGRGFKGIKPLRST